MAGNSQRRGAIRKGKKGAQVGSGGQRRRGLEGRGPTPKAEDRTGHPANRKARRDARDTTTSTRSKPHAQASELLVGRNPVAEAMRARIPATALYVAVGVSADERITEAI